MKTVLEYLEHTAALRPQAVAVEDASGTATFRELELACRKVGSALTACIAPGEPVAVLLEKGRTALFAFWGAVYAGGCYVPFNPDLPAPRLGQVQAVLGARYVITDQAHRALAEQLFPPAAVAPPPSSPPGWRASARGSSTPTPCTSTSPPAPPASPRGWW